MLLIKGPSLKYVDSFLDISDPSPLWNIFLNNAYVQGATAKLYPHRVRIIS